MARAVQRETRYRAVEAELWRSLGVTPTEHRLRLPRLGLNVRVQELGAGPPVLFVHGATTCGTSWASLARLLPNHRCLLLDRPGTGLSDPPDPPVRDIDTLVALADVLLADVLDAIGIGRADLVTTSYGGYFGLRFVLGHPERVGRIVELGWSAGAPLGPVPLLMRLGSTPSLGRLLARMPVTDASVRRLLRSIGLREALDAGRVSGEAVRAYGALLRDTDSMQNDLSIGGRFLSATTSTDPRLVLSPEDRGAIRTPMLFIWGDRDPFGGPDIAQAYAAAFPNAQLRLLEGVGHAPWMDDAEGVATSISEFLGTG
jgi:pimeloyl-ACP methyl ester carboxylesterase